MAPGLSPKRVRIHSAPVSTFERRTQVAATRAHLAALSSFAHVRYATGNGSLDLRFRIQGESLLAPAGPLRLSADATIRGDVTRLGIDGALLGGTIKVRGDVDRAHLENADALIAIAIPAVELQGHGWGPLRIDGEAHPGSIPKLDLSMVIPGVVLTGKGGRGPDQADHKADQPDDSPRFDFQARLALTDLALTARAAQAFTGGTLAPLSGHGQIDLGFGGPLTGVPASWRGHIAGGIDHLRFAGTVIDGLTIDGRTAHLSSRPEDATLDVAVGAVRAGATVLHDLKLGAKARGRELTAEVTVAGPHAVRLALAARIDEDRQGLALERLALTYPEGSWATDGVARLELGGGRLSLTSFRLLSRGQTLVIDGARSGDELDAHVALHDVRLALLPAFLVDPRLRLGGILDADVKADGNTDNPRVVARAQLQDARYQGFSRIGVTVAATLADRHVDGTLNVDAPFVAINAGFKLPTDALAPGAPLDLRLDVKRLRIAELLRGAAMEPQGDGRITAQLRLTGSADDPHVDLTATGKDLKINRPALAASRRPAAATAARSHASTASPDADETTDLGHLSLHVTYAQRRAHADLDFASAHGGTLTVDAGAQVDLSYPLATHKLVVDRIPVHGKVVARNLDVAWIAQFNDRVESLGGEVNANAKLAGTVGDPQFIGDVRWKNGKIVATGTEGTRR